MWMLARMRADRKVQRDVGKLKIHLRVPQISTGRCAGMHVTTLPDQIKKFVNVGALRDIIFEMSRDLLGQVGSIRGWKAPQLARQNSDESIMI